MKEAVVRARVAPDLKKDAEQVLATLGLNMSGAIRMFLSQVRLHGCLPFEVGLAAENGDLLLPVAKRQAALDLL